MLCIALPVRPTNCFRRHSLDLPRVRGEVRSWIRVPDLTALCPPLWGDLLVRPRASFRPGLSGRYGGNLLGAVHAEIGALREPVMEFGSLGRIGHNSIPNRISATVRL